MYTTNKNASADNLELEYSPRRWSKRFINPDDVLPSHIKAVSEESLRVQGLYGCKRDVRFGPTEREAMDVYFRSYEDGSPIFLYIHGGYWQALDKSISAYCVDPLVERGYKVIVSDYNLCPDVTLQAIVEETKRLVERVFQLAEETKASHVSFCGHSAGAHLIACLLNEINSQPNSGILKSIFLVSGVFDLREIVENDAVNSNNILSVDKESVKSLSPILFESFKSPTSAVRVHLLFAEHDSETFHNHSRVLAEKLRNHGFPCEVKQFPDYDHFDIVESLRDAASPIAKYVIENDAGC